MPRRSAACANAPESSPSGSLAQIVSPPDGAVHAQYALALLCWCAARGP